MLLQKKLIDKYKSFYVEKNKKIYLVGKGVKNLKDGEFNAKTQFDMTNKNISPMGGFVRYGEVNEDFIIMKGSSPGLVKRPITLRRSLITPINSVAREKITLKWIDTSSKMGHGRFQTGEERRAFTGDLKRDLKHK